MVRLAIDRTRQVETEGTLGTALAGKTLDVAMPRYDCFQNGRHPYGICSDFTEESDFCRGLVAGPTIHQMGSAGKVHSLLLGCKEHIIPQICVIYF